MLRENGDKLQRRPAKSYQCTGDPVNEVPAAGSQASWWALGIRGREGVPTGNSPVGARRELAEQLGIVWRRMGAVGLELTT
jgi:hypothetical protein